MQLSRLSAQRSRGDTAACRSGFDVGRRWGNTTATPEEIGRVSAALADCRTFAHDPELDAAPEVGGFLLLARLAFLIRPELAVGEGRDLACAMDEACSFWRQVMGDAYVSTRFDDHVEAVAWLRGFAEGAIDGYMGLEL